jgi:hypothetical protein
LEVATLIKDAICQQQKIAAARHRLFFKAPVSGSKNDR